MTTRGDDIIAAMKIERLELRLITLPLVRFFETSFGRSYDRTFVLVRVEGGGFEGWGEARQCALSAGAGVLQIETTAQDPFFSTQVTAPAGWKELTIRARTPVAADWEVYWQTTTVRSFGAQQMVSRRMPQAGGEPVKLMRLGEFAFREAAHSLEPDVVFANEDEERVVGRSELAATWILKRGAAGCSFGGDDRATLPVERVLDTTGAGDALAAGWIVGGPDLALEAAARCVQQVGAMPVASPG